MTPHLRDVFFDVQRGLPRQGPGCATGTLQALSMCRKLPEEPAILDIGCGPGLQTLALAGATGGSIVAVDNCTEYLDELNRRAAAKQFADRIETIAADMQSLPFADWSFDLVWSEGGAYIMGFGQALEAWKQLLKEGGYIAVTELVWLHPNPPKELQRFFSIEYPAMTSVETNIATLRDSGYALIGHFTLPDSAWWTDYYSPLKAKLPSLKQKYANDADALQVVNATRREIDLRRRFHEFYGYEFFVGRVTK